MKQSGVTKRKCIVKVALAALPLVAVLVLVLALSLAGGDKDPGNLSSADKGTEDGTSANVAGNAGTGEMMEGSIARDLVPDGNIPGESVSREEMLVNYMTVSDIRVLFPEAILEENYLAGQFQEISDKAGEEIQNAVAKMEMAYQQDPPLDMPSVKARDWSRYTSQLAREGLSPEQDAFYERLDVLCRRYLEDGALDGVEYKEYECYTTDAVSYDDLGLTQEEAYNTLWWFKYNNPQYYFLEGWGLRTSKALYPYLYDFAADGKERVKITNELFDRLDGWIESVNGDGLTNWQRGVAANNLLCRNIVYNREYMGNFRIDQSLYSAVMMESTVCAGYSEAYCAMMNASGVETVVALSPVHAWNVILADDGNYYAVDVTWNDNEDNDEEPDNQFLNVGEVSLKAYDSEMDHTYREEYETWIPGISRDDYVPTQYDRTGLGQDGDTALLEPPANLRVVSDEDGVIGILWDAVDSATGYTVEIYSSDRTRLLASASFQEPYMTASYGTRESLAVRVRAQTMVDGEEYVSDWSEFLLAETSAMQLPDVDVSEQEGFDTPGNLGITDVGADYTSFTWDRVEGAMQYEAALFKDAECNEIWVSGYVTDPSIKYVRLQPDTTYYYGVRAIRTVDGEDIYSDWGYISQRTMAEAR